MCGDLLDFFAMRFIMSGRVSMTVVQWLVDVVKMGEGTFYRYPRYPAANQSDCAQREQQIDARTGDDADTARDNHEGHARPSEDG